MIRVGLLDTTIPGAPGSMARYRDQLVGALVDFCGNDFDVATEYLGCDSQTLDRTPPRLRMWRRHFHIWRAAQKMNADRFDIVHLLDGSFGYVSSAVRAKRVAVTVHDIIPRLQMDGEFSGAPPVGRGARWLIGKCLRGVESADVACSVSQNTADDLKRFGCVSKNGIRVVPSAIESELFDGPRLSESEVGQSGPFLFHLGNNGFYKNRGGAIEIFKRIDPTLELRLVLAGPSPDQALLRLAAESNVSDRIDFIDDPSQALLSKLYRGASAFVFPSLYEGFGWPPLEAMAAGCPVVASDSGSLPEVVGDAGVVEEFGDYEAMARGCERLLKDHSFRESMIAAGRERVKHFSRERMAERMAIVYHSMMEDGPA